MSFQVSGIDHGECDSVLLFSICIQQLKKIFVCGGFRNPLCHLLKSTCDISFQTFRRVPGLSCEFNSSVIEVIKILICVTHAN